MTASVSPGREQPAQVGGVTLESVDPFGDPGLGRPPLERGERIWTRIDHRDPVAADGQRDGDATGPAAQVDEVERTPLPRDQLVELVGEQGLQVGLGHGATAAHFDHAAEDTTDAGGDRAAGLDHSPTRRGDRTST